MARVKLLTVVLLVMILGIGIFGYLFYIDLNPIPDIQVNSSKSVGWNFIFALYGSEDIPFSYPTAVTVHNDKIYVSDSKDPQIRVFSAKGKPLNSIGKGRLKQPYGLVFAGNELYVSDVELNKILIFDAEGKFEQEFPLKEGVIGRPGGLAFANDKLYVTDLGAMQVVALNLDGSKLTGFGQNGSGNGEFKYPHGVAFDTQGNIYVSDAGNARVQVFSPEGKFLRVIGAKDNEPGEIVSARGIAVDKQGNVYVASGLAGRVKVYDNEGKPGKDLGGEGSENGKFALPTGLYLDGDRLYVTEVGNKRVSIFANN